MGELDNYIKNRQTFLKFADGEEFSGYFLGYKLVPDKFKIKDDPEARTVVYKFQTSDGKEIEWTCGNLGVAKKMVRMREGQALHIQRDGQGPKTAYLIQVLPQNLYETRVPNNFQPTDPQATQSEEAEPDEKVSF